MPPKRKAPEKKPKAPADEEEHVEAVEDIPKEKNAAPAKKAKAASSTASASSNKLAVGDNVSSVTVTLTTEDNKEVTLSDITVSVFYTSLQLISFCDVNFYFINYLVDQFIFPITFAERHRRHHLHVPPCQHPRVHKTGMRF